MSCLTIIHLMTPHALAPEAIDFSQCCPPKRPVKTIWPNPPGWFKWTCGYWGQLCPPGYAKMVHLDPKMATYTITTPYTPPLAALEAFSQARPLTPIQVSFQGDRESGELAVDGWVENGAFRPF